MRGSLLTCCSLTIALWLGVTPGFAGSPDAGVADDQASFHDDSWLRERSRVDVTGFGFDAAGTEPAVGAENLAPKSAVPVTVPLPPAAWPGAVGLVGVGMFAIRRFRRR